MRERELEKLAEMINTSKTKGDLSPERNKLFELLLKKIRIILPSSLTIPRRQVTSPCDLSDAQMAIWSEEQAAPGNPALILTAAIRMRGEVDEEALSLSLNDIISRHEILRTSFPIIDGKPVQAIAEWATVELQLEDLTILAQQQREQEARRLASMEAKRGFDLELGPVIRAKLVRMSKQERVFVVSLHHIVADGWSMGIFIRELAAFYESHTKGKEAKVEELPVQYADYAVWQRERMKGEWYDKEVRYWREKLVVEEGEAVREIEADRARPAERKHRGAKVRQEMSERLRGEMKEASRREAVTEYMMMMGGLKVLMSRYSGQEEVIVGTAVANRNQWEVGGSIGMYANTVIAKTDLRGNPEMREVIKRVRREVIEVLEHQEVAYQKVVEELREERDTSREGMFGVMFVMQSGGVREMEMEGVEVEEMEIEEGVSKFDIKVEVKEKGRKVEVEIEYDEELYERGTIERMMRHYEKVMEVIIREPDRRLSDLPAHINRRGARDEG
jgi:hypothetical protein